MLNTLLVIAHPAEAQAFTIPHLVTGFGKINATLGLTKHLTSLQSLPEKIVVLGTAGRVNKNIPLKEIVQVTEAFEHDFVFSNPKTISFTKNVTPVMVGTGDVFVTDVSLVESLGADLVDMETYAYARVAESFGVPLEVYKYVSDDADGEAENDWDTQISKISGELSDFYCEYVMNL